MQALALVRIGGEQGWTINSGPSTQPVRSCKYRRQVGQCHEDGHLRSIHECLCEEVQKSPLQSAVQTHARTCTGIRGRCCGAAIHHAQLVIDRIMPQLKQGHRSPDT